MMREDETAPSVTGGKVSPRCNSLRICAEVDGLVIWGVVREDSATASG
jgi:hypothetical protein